MTAALERGVAPLTLLCAEQQRGVTNARFSRCLSLNVVKLFRNTPFVASWAFTVPTR